LPIHFENCLEEKLIWGVEPEERVELNFSYPQKQILQSSIRNCFKHIENELVILPEDIRYSGTTCTALLIFA